MLATDEVWRLQNCDDPECRVFQNMTKKGHYRRQFHQTRQGFYVCSADGTLLSSGNSNSPKRILNIMRAGLEAWQEQPSHANETPATFEPEHRWEDSYPDEGLVLVAVMRDLPITRDPSSACGKRWNQDPVWYSKGEMLEWLPADQFATEATYQVPKHLVHRLAKYHLLDRVRGQSTPFRDKEVHDSALEVELMERDGDRLTLRITGRTRADSRRRRWRTTPRGVATTVLGKATFNTELQSFEDFELVALGERWGRTDFNDRADMLQPSPIGFVIRSATENDPRIAPAHLASYGADWIKFP